MFYSRLCPSEFNPVKLKTRLFNLSLDMQLLHTTCIAPISAVSFSRIRSGVTDISLEVKYTLPGQMRFNKQRDEEFYIEELLS